MEIKVNLYFLVCLCSLASLPLLEADKTCTGNGQFFGGSVSYTLEEVGGKFMLNLDVITGWVLQMGPCGRNCSKASVGSSTKQTRAQIENEMNNTNYFGEWISEIKRPSQALIPTPVTDTVRAAMTGTVLAVSETSKWEQELMKVTLPVEANLSHKDINYDGCSWRNLSRQGENLAWHIQAKIDPVKVRSDTQKPNGSPQVLYKPFYRLKLNKESTIRIAATDPDDDYIKCGQSLYVESGVFAKPGHRLAGVTIEEDCSIRINASSSLGFRDQDWAAVVITVRDFNKQPIHFGSDIHNVIAPGMFSLSSTAVQFLILVLANLEEPEFVSPTLEGNHLFHLYADTMWTTEVYAKANGNATLEEFIFVTRGGENITQSPIKSDRYRPGVKYITISWEPDKADLGNHLICIRAVDNTGVDSSMDRCFIVNVGEKNFTGVTHVSAAKPYFYNLPTLQDLTCQVDTTCVIPIYVKSHGRASITTIHVTQVYVDHAHVSSIRKKAQNDFKTDLYFRDSKSGVNKICMIAEDSNGIQSNETCIDSDIKPTDPCAALPCANSAVCKKNPSDEADYICICSSKKFSGKRCEKQKKQECNPNPCLRGFCNSTKPTGQKCQCPEGYGGIDCGTSMLINCTSNPCNQHGVCSNGPVDFTCDCFKRYTGQNCSTDLCSSASTSVLSCPAGPGCSSSTCNGVCSSGGKCICSYGFLGPQCKTGLGNMQSPTIQFVPPTPSQSSSLNCYFYAMTDCTFSVFITTPQSSSTTVTIGKQSDELKGTTSVGSITEEKNIAGVQYLYKATVTITKGHAFQKDIGGRRYLCLLALESTTNSSDHRCFEILLLYNSAFVSKSQEFSNIHSKHIKFLPPTPLAESRFGCQKDVRCHVFLHTTLKSPCNAVFTTSPETTVFPPVTSSTSCFTEASYTFSATGEHRVCFVAAATDGQTRCFNIEIYKNDSDPCMLRPCQNSGLCFHKGTNDSYCVCPAQFTGDRCERGPCLTSDNTCDKGFCYVDNKIKTCLCPIGSNGLTCNQSVPTSFPNPERNGAVFTDSAVPELITCIKNKPCTVPFLLSGNYSTPSGGPTMKPGYIDPSVNVDYITVASLPSANGSFQGHVQLTPSKPGIQDICLQTTDKTGINRDEICFSVDVKTDTSTLYGFTDLPHFTEPSIPASSVVSCGVGEPCHMVFHATPGENFTKECVSVKEMKKNFQNLHVFVSCDCADGEVGMCVPCSPGSLANNNCSIDVSVLPLSSEKGTGIEVCLQASLKGLNINGEERCINVTVEDIAVHRKKLGCQLLHCKNGGFCDGHTAKAICYCPFGYTGQECETDITGNPLTNATDLPALLDSGLPNEVKCYQNETCNIPFQVIGENQTRPIVTTGYVDPDLKGAIVDIWNGSLSSSMHIYNGTILVKTPNVGMHKLCLQTHNSKNVATDEKCITVNVEGKPRTPVDSTKPHFLNPSPTQGSTLACKTQSSCFINLFYTTGDMFGIAGTCPVLSQSGKTTEGLHLFEAKHGATSCTSTLSYIAHPNDAGTVHQLCFRVSIPGKKGEERCFNVEVKRRIINIGPCKYAICLNGGRCIADITSGTAGSVGCVCPGGFTGSFCSPVTSNTLQNMTTGLPGTPPPIFTDSAVPNHVVCYEGLKCNVPVTVHGSKDPLKRPLVVFGHTDPGIYPGIPSVAPKQPGGSYMAVLPFTPENGTTGLHRVCVQTKDPILKVNVDEICFDVDVLSGHSNSSGTPGNPGFLPPTLNTNTTVLCKPTKPCHVFSKYNKDANNTSCPVLVQATSEKHVLSFPPQEQNGTCNVDTVITPSPNQNGKTLHICLHPSGVKDTKCYNIKISGTNSGPCHDLHCQNGGFCDHVNGKAVCICKSGFTGPSCENATTISFGPLPGVKGINLTSTTGTPSFDNSSAIPTVVKCEANKLCQIPILFHGNVSQPPILGHVDPNLRPVITTVNPVKPPDTHLLLSTLNTTKDGRFCLQSVDQNSQINIDEICIDVEVENKSIIIDKTLPHFQDPSLTNGTEIICLSEQTCHLPVITAVSQNGTCASPSICSSRLDGIHVFEPHRLNSSVCTTDVAVAASKASQRGDVCISSGPGGEQRVITINRKSTGGTSFGPCQKLHCENGGTCDQKMNTPMCKCLPDFTGPTCSDYVTTTVQTTELLTTTQSTDQTTSEAITSTVSSTTTPPSTSTSTTDLPSTSSESTSTLTTTATSLTTSTSTTTGPITSMSTSTSQTPTTSQQLTTDLPSASSGTTSIPSSSTSTVQSTPTSITTSTSSTTSMSTSTRPLTSTSTSSSQSSSSSTSTNPITSTSISTGLITSTSTSSSPSTSTSTSTSPIPSTSSLTSPFTSTSTSTSPITSTSTSTSSTSSTKTSTSLLTSTSTSSSHITSTSTSTSPITSTSSSTSHITSTSTLPSPITSTSTSTSPITSKSTLTSPITSTSTSTSSIPSKSTSTSPITSASTSASPTTSKSTSTSPITSTSTSTSSISSKSTSTSPITSTSTSTSPIPSKSTSTSPITSTSTSTSSISSTSTSTSPITSTYTLSSKATASSSTSTSPSASARTSTTQLSSSSDYSTNSPNASLFTTSTPSPNTFTTHSPSTRMSNLTQLAGTCNMKQASQKAREAVKLGHASCYCMVNGTKKQIIRRRPVATTKQLLKAAGIGAGGSVGTMTVLALAYLLISKFRAAKKTNEPRRRRPTSSPRARAKIHPERNS